MNSFGYRTGLPEFYYYKLKSHSAEPIKDMRVFISFGIGLNRTLFQMEILLKAAGFCFIPGYKPHEAYKMLFEVVHPKDHIEANTFLEMIGLEEKFLLHDIDKTK